MICASRLAFVGLLAGVVVPARSAMGQARGQVDPRYSYAVEGDFSVGSFISFGTAAGRAQLFLGGAAVFLAPVAENRQISISLKGGSGSDSQGTVHFGTLAVGYRWLREFDRLETRLDLQLAADVSHITTTGTAPPPSDFALGAVAGFGALYEFARSWRVGLVIEGGFYAIHLRAQFQATPVLTFSW